MTLYQVLHEIQIVLALSLGACPACCQPLTLDRLAAGAELGVGHGVQRPGVSVSPTAARTRP